MTEGGDEPDWNRLTTSVFRVCRSRGLSESDAADVAQVSVYRAWLRWSEGYNFALGIEAWVLRVARNGIFRLSRDRTSHSRIETTYLHRHENVIDFGESVEEDRRDLIGRAIEKLPAEERRVLLLHYFFDRQYEEIAIALKRPVGTIRSLAKRGRERLKEILGNGEGGLDV